MRAIGLDYEGRPIVASVDGRTFYTLAKDGSLHRERDLNRHVIEETLKKLGPRPMREP